MNKLLTLLLFIVPSFSPAALPFYWGVANAAFQVEGQPSPSDWRDWTHGQGKIEDGTNADLAVRFWSNYREHFKLSQKLGAKAFRMSVAWERIQPSPDQWDDRALQHYIDIVKTMREYGLEPFITLHHFVLPRWLADEGGILSKNFPARFATFTQKVVTALGPYCDHWMTFNEPNILSNAGYVEGSWPPGIKGEMKTALKAQLQMARAHVLAFRKIKAIGTNHKVGIAQNWRVFQPATTGKLDSTVTDLVEFLFDRYFVNALVKGRPCQLPIGEICGGSGLSANEKVLDFIGINYYGRSIVRHTNQPPFFEVSEADGPKTDVGWEMYPQGLLTALTDVSKFGFPIVITENGLADAKDQWRSKFVGDHVAQMQKAMAKGIAVKGYFYWSLTDNFEWARGLTPRFGLVDVDYSTGAMTPRPSFQEFSKIISTYPLGTGSLQK